MNTGINFLEICIADGIGAFLAFAMLGVRIWNNEGRERETRLLRGMLITVVLSCVSDILCFACDGRPGTWAFLAVYLGNLELYIANMVIGTLWVVLLTVHAFGGEISKRQKIMIFTLDTAGTVAILINFFRPVVYSVSAENVYSRGQLFWLYVAIELIFILDGFASYFIARKRIPETAYFPIWEFIIPTMIGVTAQSFVYGISTIWPGVAVAISWMCFTLFTKELYEQELALQEERRLLANENQLRQEQARMREQLEIQQKELQEALAAAESANAAKTDFLFNMSHDIRTPMNAILGFTTMALKHAEDRGMVTDCLGKVKSSGEFMLSLLNDILDMAKIDQGKLEIEEESVILPDLVISLEDMVRESARDKDLKLDFNCDDLPDDSVWADPLHLRRVMMNIITNAIKYTRPGGFVKVNLRELPSDDPEKGLYEFTVEDNGVGMTPEFVGHIFERFERERNSTTSGIQGTGLGMSITKSILDMMNGTISVESEVGKGSTFTVTVPLKFNREIQRREDSQGMPEYENARFDGMRVLLVEDNLLNREIAMDVLNDFGIVVEEAEDGAIAVEKVSASKPGYYHLVLMDIQMPYMDGYQATRAIRNLEDPGLAEIPVYALSANVYPEDKRKSAEAGMNGHLGKPLEMAELLQALRKHAPADAGKVISDEDEFMKPDSEGAQDACGFDESRYTVLITDDSEINRKFLSRMLRGRYNIVEAENGREALDILRSGGSRIDLILLDLSMPVMTGFEFMEEWKKDESISRIPVMVQTAGNSSDGEILSLRLGASDFIKRPYQSEIVLHRVANAIRKNRQNS